MHKHIKTCAAIGEVTDKHWDTAWAYGEMVWADSHGNHHEGDIKQRMKNKYSWLRVPCNDASCEAYLMIRMDAFLKELPQT